ncbi:MAG: hypothetical protein AB7O45_04970 [Alphaproteobacteria bacterium]
MIRRARTLNGANWISAGPVVVVEVEGGYPAAEWPAALGLLDRLLPTGTPDPPVGPPPERAAAAVAIVAGRICAWAGFPPRAAAMAAIGDLPEGVAALPVGFVKLTRDAMRMAADLLSAARAGTDQAFLATTRPVLLALKAAADDHLKTARRTIAWAAERQGLPFHQHSVATTHVQVGEGRHGRLFDGASTWRTSAIAMHFARNKPVGHRLLRRAGVPVAPQIAVTDLDSARAAIGRLGLPMVLKPANSHRQTGVSFVYRPEDLPACHAHSAATGLDLVAERFLPGKEYRALVIDGELVSVLQTRAAAVVGDGRSSIAALVAAANDSGRRGQRSHGFVMTPIPWDEVALRYLASRGLAPDDVPPEGVRIETYPLPMMRVGGDPQLEVVETVHPETRAMLVRAVQAIGLDVAGVDLRMPDIGRDWREVGAGICEVNGQPNIGLHYNVREANARDVASILLDRIYPPAERGEMIHILVIARSDRTAAGRSIAEAVGAARGWRVGLTSAALVELAGYRSSDVPVSRYHAQVMAIEDRSLDGAVHVMTPDDVVSGGLGVLRARLALIEPAEASAGRAGALVHRSATTAGARIATLPASDAEAARLAVAELAAGGRRAAAA